MESSETTRKHFCKLILDLFEESNSGSELVLTQVYAELTRSRSRQGFKPDLSALESPAVAPNRLRRLLVNNATFHHETYSPHRCNIFKKIALQGDDVSFVASAMEPIRSRIRIPSAPKDYARTSRSQDC